MNKFIRWLLIPILFPIVLAIGLILKIVEVIKDCCEKLYYWTYDEVPD